MSSYFNNLQEEEYQPPSSIVTANNKARKKKNNDKNNEQQQQQQQQQEELFLQAVNMKNSRQYGGAVVATKEDSQSKSRSRSRSRSASRGSRSNVPPVVNNDLKQDGKDAPSSSPSSTLSFDGDGDGDGDGVDGSSAHHSSPSSYSSKNNNKNKRSSNSNGSSKQRHRTSNKLTKATSGPSSQKNGDIYKAYKRLSYTTAATASSSNANGVAEASQQTPVTASSTQVSNGNEYYDEQYHYQYQLQHPGPHKQKQQQQQQHKQQQKQQQQQSNLDHELDHRDPSYSSSYQISVASLSYSSNQSPSITRRPSQQIKQLKMSKQKRQTKKGNGNTKSNINKKSQPIPSHVTQQQQYHAMNDDNNNDNKNNNNSNSKQQLQSTTKPPTSVVLDHSANSNDSSNSGEISERREPLRQTMQQGKGIPKGYNRTMDTVKQEIRSELMSSTEDNSSSSTTTSSSSNNNMGDNSNKQIRGFLNTTSSNNNNNKEKKTKKTKEEKQREKLLRRQQQNPFLNRPKPIRINSGFGYQPGEGTGDGTGGMDGTSKSQLSKNNDHHYNHGGTTDHQNNDDTYTSMGIDSTKQNHKQQEEEHQQLTIQQKYCPLPKPLLKIQQFCGKVVTNQSFQIFMVVLIMLNAIVLGIATYDFDNPKIPEALDYIDRTLLVIFSVELALQFTYCGYTLLLDGWLVFDTLTVVTSWWLEGVQVFRSFRIFRSFRLIVRLPLLKNLVLTVFHVMPRVYSILALMLLILYIYGVMCTVLFGDMYALQQTDKQYFGRLDYSLFTLFQMVTLEGWGDVVRQVAEVHPIYASLIFSSFIIATGFIMYNLIVAVMCDSMLVVEAQDRAQKKAKKHEEQRSAEIAKQEEEKKLTEEMDRQRHEKHIERQRAKGIIDDDPSVADTDNPSNSAFDVQRIDEDDNSVIEYRQHVCVACGYCDEIPKLSASERRRNRVRDAIMLENQERVRSLKQKVDQMAKTQQQVTSVLQTLILEIEATRDHASTATSTSRGSRSYYKVD